LYGKLKAFWYEEAMKMALVIIPANKIGPSFILR
jgi:hypothetical protein